MNVVLDTLFLQQLRIHYTAPPMCLTNFTNQSVASGSAAPIIVLQPIAPLTSPTLPNLSGACNNFLKWANYSRQICSSLYLSATEAGSYTTLLDCIPQNSVYVCSAGLYKISIVFSDGSETVPLTGVLCDGSEYLNIPLPASDRTDIVGYRLYKRFDTVNPIGPYVLYLDTFTGNVAETCSAGCYRVSAITPDGETPLSNPVCLTPTCDGHIEVACPPGYIFNGLSCLPCEVQTCLSGQHWDSILCECIDDYGNDAITQTAQCPTNGAITVTATIPAFTYHSNNPADYPWKLNSMAQQALASLLFFDLEVAGCCPGTGIQITDAGLIVNNTDCDLEFGVYSPLGGFFDPTYHTTNVGAHTSINWPVYLHSLTGSPILPGTQGYFSGYGITTGFTCIGIP